MTDKFYSITEFRANIYGMIDNVLKKGEVVLLRRNGRILEIREKPGKKTKKTPKIINDLSKIKARADIITEPLEWYISPKLDAWNPDRDLY